MTKEQLALLADSQDFLAEVADRIADTETYLNELETEDEPIGVAVLGEIL